LCEFKVYLETEGKQELIAEDITNAKLDENSLVLTDILGRTTKVEGALITEIDVKKESLRVYTSPVIFELLKLFISFEPDLSALNELQSAWKAVKARGDELIGSFKSTREGAQH